MASQTATRMFPRLSSLTATRRTKNISSNTSDISTSVKSGYHGTSGIAESDRAETESLSESIMDRVDDLIYAARSDVCEENEKPIPTRVSKTVKVQLATQHRLAPPESQSPSPDLCPHRVQNRSSRVERIDSYEIEPIGDVFLPSKEDDQPYTSRSKMDSPETRQIDVRPFHAPHWRDEPDSERVPPSAPLFTSTGARVIPPLGPARSHPRNHTVTKNDRKPYQRPDYRKVSLKCLQCQQTLPSSSFSQNQLSKVPCDATHHTLLCKDCSKARYAQQGFRKCFACGVTKAPKEFSKAQSRFGDAARCLDCMKEIH